MFQALGGRGGLGRIGLLVPLSWALLEWMVRKGLVLQGVAESSFLCWRALSGTVSGDCLWCRVLAAEKRCFLPLG